MSLKHRIDRLATRARRVRLHDPYPQLVSILAEKNEQPAEMRHYGPTRWLILRVPPGTSSGPPCWVSLAPEQRARIGPRTSLLVGLSPEDT